MKTNLADEEKQEAIPALRTEHLGRKIGDQVLLEDINFTIASGEIMAIVGPSGSGKSSLLRLLNRLDEPTSGYVYLDGIDYRTIPPRELRRRVGMVMQAPYLFPGTIAENIAYGPVQRGETVSPETIRFLLEQVGLPGWADRDIARLSGGEAQRVSLARTLANNPEILLLDEPTSALDDDTKQDVESLIFGIVRRQTLTCLIVTHDLIQASRVAERAMILESGHIIKIGKITEVLHA